MRSELWLRRCVIEATVSWELFWNTALRPSLDVGDAHLYALLEASASYLVDHDPATPVVFGPQEQKAVDLLADAGLIPRSKFESSHGVA